jgi:hypothetical protein
MGNVPSPGRSGAVSGTAIDLVRLAELLIERVGPALPEGVVVSLAAEEDLERLRRIRARTRDLSPPDFPPPPEYGHEDGVLCVSVPPSPSRRVFALTYNRQRVFTDDALSGILIEALGAVADEASEASADHHECDAALEDQVLRIWFGVVPPKMPHAL